MYEAFEWYTLNRIKISDKFCTFDDNENREGPLESNFKKFTIHCYTQRC